MANIKNFTLLLLGLLGIYLLYTVSANSYLTPASVAAAPPQATPTTSTISMSQYIVTLNESADDSLVSKVKESIKKLGGEIVSEYTLIKGFVIKLPQIHTDSVKKLDGVATFEEDQEVKIQ